MKPGATPNDTTSESESRSAPMGECAFSNRAVKPSKKSKSPATKIMIAAATGIPEKENKMEKQPEIRLPQVMVLGICCFRLTLFHSFQCANSILISHFN